MNRKNLDPLRDETPRVGFSSKKQVAEKLRRQETLQEVDLRGLDLSGLNFDGQDLRSAKLAESNLDRATFRHAKLQGASLWHASLKEAVFDGANLEDTDLDMAELDGATFKGARVRRTLFPYHRLPLDRIQASIHTGCPVVMDRGPLDDE